MRAASDSNGGSFFPRNTICGFSRPPFHLGTCGPNHTVALKKKIYSFDLISFRGLVERAINKETLTLPCIKCLTAKFLNWVTMVPHTFSPLHMSYSQSQTNQLAGKSPDAGHTMAEQWACREAGHEWPLTAWIMIAWALFVVCRSFWATTRRKRAGLCTATSLQLGSEFIFLEWMIGFSPWLLPYFFSSGSDTSAVDADRDGGESKANPKVSVSVSMYVTLFG